jgi:hypothetical protein
MLHNVNELLLLQHASTTIIIGTGNDLLASNIHEYQSIYTMTYGSMYMFTSQSQCG